MSQDIDLPACDFVLDGINHGCYYDYTVRRLIAEAVKAEELRWLNLLAGDPRPAEISCIQGLRNVIEADTKGVMK